MKIKKVSCSQFAGIRDRSISFDDGINVIYGKNETGKSTVVNLISRTLFQNAKIDGRKDKEFVQLYFPITKKGTRSGDFADGEIVFETENGSYRLSKEWGADASCKLSTPDGIIKDQDLINKILKSELLYGEGVYSKLLLSSQANTNEALRALLNPENKDELRTDITDAVSQAFAESDGLSMDAIEAVINQKIEIAGKHWDFERAIPARKSGGGRWSIGRGEILNAYYALEDAKNIQDEISRKEKAVDFATKEYVDRANAIQPAKNELEQFEGFYNALVTQSHHKNAVSRIKDDLSKTTRIRNAWPELNSTINRAKVLENEINNRNLLDKYNSAKEIANKIHEIESALKEQPCPTSVESRNVRASQDNISRLKNKLCGMNLTAAIQMIGGDSIKITSVCTGLPIDISDGIASITEAVNITIPGIMEMQLVPADVDVVSVESQIAHEQKSIQTIFEKYHVDSLAYLEHLGNAFTEKKKNLDFEKNHLEMLLGASSFEELESSANSLVSPPRMKTEIEEDIQTICNGKKLSTFITEKETIVNGYISEYGSIHNLEETISDLNLQLERAQEALAATEDIPVEYSMISDPERHRKMLKNDLEEKQNILNSSYKKKSDAESSLESYKDNLLDDPASNLEKAKEHFEDQKSLLSHWMHIKQVFDLQKQNVHDNPMQDIAGRFADYLHIVSGGRVSSEFIDADKLSPQVYSNESPLDYSKLSEGTKETVSLSFRLAVLDHLFPDGGGVLVLDDPFANMDSDRAARSCELIKECAKRHQVIFLTCKEEYGDLLSGNKIFV